jgi:hypothetical protein
MRDWEDVKVKFDGNSTEHIKLDYGLIVVSLAWLPMRQSEPDLSSNKLASVLHKPCHEP